MQVEKAVDGKKLSVRYNGQCILDDVTLHIKEGEFVSILGPNGAGKTTLIKVLTDIIPTEQGEVFLYSRSIKSYSRRELAQMISFLPQNLPVSLPFKVYDIVMMGRFPYLRRFEMERPHDRETVHFAMELLDIHHLSGRHLLELSGGEVKRVFIAQAIAQESKLLFLDEPTANLDINYQIEIFRILQSFNLQLKKTIILITHDINHAARFTNRIILMKNGKIVCTGDPNEVITEQNLARVFDTKLQIQYNKKGRPYVLI